MSKARVIGIDADRKRLAVVRHLDGDTTRYTVDRQNDKGDIYQGYSIALASVMESAAKHRVVVFLEGAFLANLGGLSRGAKARAIDTFRVLSNVQGEIVYEATRHGVDVRIVPPKDWQQRILGFCKDREKLKAASAQEGRRMLKSWDLSEHESDAACICLYGLWVLRNEESKQRKLRR